MEIISPEQRKNKHCYFCGTGESVKYVVEVNDYVLDIHPVKVYCCNKYVLSYNKKRATQNDERYQQRIQLASYKIKRN